MRDVLILLGFRPHVFAELASALLLVENIRIHIFQDGPRENQKERDNELIEENKRLVKYLKQEGKEVSYRRQPVNGGVKRLDIGISWFFDKVERGVILEEDCIPTSTSFDFLFDMLERYSDDAGIGGISAYSCLGSLRSVKDGDNNRRVDHFVSNLTYTWGWATWKSSWEALSVIDISPGSLDKNSFKALGSSRCDDKIIEEVLLSLASNHYDYWDYSLLMRILKKKMLFIHPEHSLIRNVGFGKDASHKHSKSIKGDIEIFEKDYSGSERIEIDMAYVNTLLFYTAYCDIPRKLRPLFLKRLYWLGKYRIAAVVKKLIQLAQKQLADSVERLR